MTTTLKERPAERTTSKDKLLLVCPAKPQTTDARSRSCSRPKQIPYNSQPESASWQELKDRFLQLLDSQTPAVDWRLVWRLLVEHPWYQSQLDYCATWVLRSGKAPHQWLDDLRQDAILLLARTLRQRPDLGIDRCRANDKFAPWLRTIIVRDCREALRRMRRLHRRETALPQQPPTVDRRQQLDVQIDLSMAIDALANPDRTLVSMYLHGYSVKEIARRLQRNYGSTNYELRRVMAGFQERVRKLGIFTAMTKDGSAA